MTDGYEIVHDAYRATAGTITQRYCPLLLQSRSALAKPVPTHYRSLSGVQSLHLHFMYFSSHALWQLQTGDLKIDASNIEIGKAIYQEGTLPPFCYMLAMTILALWFRSEFF